MMGFAISSNRRGVKKMRMSDLGQLYDAVSDNWCGTDVASVSDILDFIKDSPTIDPETLPIVQELRKELERVTAERDAAIADLYYTCACETCALHYTDKCPLKKGMVPCSHIASALINNTPYKWRGIQEVHEDEQL